MGVFFVKKWTFPQRSCITYSISIFFILHFTYVGGCTQRTLPTGLTMQKHNKSIDNARAVTGGPNLRLRYVNKMDDTL